jgi:Protein of unknown function (DUF1838)
MQIDRRTIMTASTIMSAAALAGVPVLGDAHARGVPAGVDLKDPNFNLRALSRLQGGMDERVSYGFQRGHVYGIINGRGLPIDQYGKKLYGYEGGGLRKARVLADGSVQTVSRGWLFYTDAETGEYMTEFTNPYSNEKVTVPIFRAGISGGTLTKDGPKTSANFTMESTIYNRPTQLEYSFLGDRAFISRHAFTRWKPRAEPNQRTEMTIDVWDCAIRDLFNDRNTGIARTTSWTSQTEFQTWLKMPETVQGHQIWKADGARVSAIADLPARFVARCMADPETAKALNDPLVFPA